MPRAPWQDRGLEAVLARWSSDPATRACLALHARLPGRAGRYRPLPPELSPALAGALQARGITQLYEHQHRAWQAARAGRHVVVATPTASGKSLCYHLPVAQALAAEPGARALYLFPTKALAHDQAASLAALLRAAGVASRVVAYDGDTPAEARRAARAGGVVVTNPDMLHAGMLPHHTAWAHLLAALRYVVLDELHAYTGVFGSHVANVLRRLRRVARFYGSAPVFLCASATIGNPAAHAQRLLGEPVELVEGSGAPAGERHVVIYNPPVLDAELGLRASYVKQSVRLAGDLVRAGVPTLVFGGARNTVETMLRYLRDRLVPEGVPEASLQAYRGGYLPALRRKIEEGLRTGAVRCVVATSALELGIDAGEIDAVVCAGYPGTVAGTWQRFGRAGRRGAPALALLVTSGAPLDQYLAREPRCLMDAGVEEARIDPDNVEVLLGHLECATFELPFTAREPFGALGAAPTGEALEHLAQEGRVHRSGGRWHWVAGTAPAQEVSLRSAGRDGYVVVEAGRNQVLAELDARGALLLLHEQAIYQHEGVPYHVVEVDHDARRAVVRPSEADYFTTAITQVRVEVLEETDRGDLGRRGPGACRLADVRVATRVVGFKRVRFHTHESLGQGVVEQPELQMLTTAMGLALPADLAAALEAQPDGAGSGAGRTRVLDGLRGLAHALKAVASLALMCDPRDLGSSLGGEEAVGPRRDGEPGTAPEVFVFDAVPGGVGLAARVFGRREELLGRTRRLVASCPCAAGCPGCVLPGEEGGRLGRKAQARAILEALGLPEVP